MVAGKRGWYSEEKRILKAKLVRSDRAEATAEDGSQKTEDGDQRIEDGGSD
jgi:hypothetical protein